MNWSPLNQAWVVNTLRPRQNGHNFTDDTFKCIFMNENVRIWINISLKFVSKGLINNIPALVKIMAWCWPGNKPLSEPMMVNLLTHICITLPQWVNCGGCEEVYTALNLSVQFQNYSQFLKHSCPPCFLNFTIFLNYWSTSLFDIMFISVIYRMTVMFH